MLENYDKLRLQCVKYTGPIPRHVALIMDGNRRFARKQGADPWTGHSHGYSSLLRVLEWCHYVGVKVVSVYAFSIENFKRPKNEVDVLLELAEKAFQKFCETKEKGEGCKVNVLGDLSLLPEKTKRACAHAMHETKHYDGLTLNICFAYTSGEEMTRTVRDMVDATRAGIIEKDDIDPEFISKCLYTRGDAPDLLIRTSGETRLSDFMVWQMNQGTHICFLDVTWPEISCWVFTKCIWEYQTYYNSNKESPFHQMDTTITNEEENNNNNNKPLLLLKRQRQQRYLQYLEMKTLEFCKTWLIKETS